MSEKITLKGNRVVLKSDYIKAKTQDLIEYGYTGIDEDETEMQLNLVLENKTEGLSIIGRFIQDDFEKSE